MTQFSMSGVEVRFAATTILRDVTFTVGAGERWGIVGRNGSGKTTLLRLLTGDLAPTTGSVARVPGLRFAVLDQHRDFQGATTVWQAVADAFRQLIDLEDALAEQAHAIAAAGANVSEQVLNRYARDLERFEHEGGYTYISRVDAVLEGLGFNAASARGQPLAQLSGGERGRVGLARQLVIPADVLLLDEPTNHLDLEMTQWLEEFLRDTPETVMVISHDRALLDRVVDHVLHVEDETTNAYNGGYAAFVRQRAERRLSQNRAYSRQQKAIAREEDYIRRNIAGQNTRQAKGRRKRLEWLPRLSAPPDDESTMAVRFPTSARGGDQVLVCEHATIRVGERVLVNDFTGWIRRGDVVGLIGPNGTGKTTFLKAMLGERPVTHGAMRVGGGISPAMYRQDFANVPRDKTLYDVIADLRPMWERGSVMGHLGRVQFSGDEVQRIARSLSGGELARVALASMMLSNANFLIFDEPTNHLDVESIEELEDAISRFEGTVLLVSHDRELLRKLVTRVWELRDGQLRVWDGDFAEWEERQASTIAAKLAQAATAESERRALERAASRKGVPTVPAPKSNARDVKRALERAEARVTEGEARERELIAALADPALYESTDRHARAQAIGRELATVREELAISIAEWETAVVAVEALERDPERARKREPGRGEQDGSV